VGLLTGHRDDIPRHLLLETIVEGSEVQDRAEDHGFPESPCGSPSAHRCLQAALVPVVPFGWASLSPRTCVFRFEHLLIIRDLLMMLELHDLFLVSWFVVDAQCVVIVDSVLRCHDGGCRFGVP
jgi:hypothetical protein